ncbi:MAG: hypothetical protein IJU84_08795 [Clostridia bacterium]|nr:hypothetical protein [Clostridia bacterium]
MLNFFRNKKPYYYILFASFALALASVIIYVSNGANEYNKENISGLIVAMLIAGMVFTAAAAVFELRYIKYVAYACLFYGFLQFVITELNFWGNFIIATDPVPAEAQRYYLSLTVIMLLSWVTILVSALWQKSSEYKKEKEQDKEVAAE